MNPGKEAPSEWTGLPQRPTKTQPEEKPETACLLSISDSDTAKNE
jgi:hypothetical protein